MLGIGLALLAALCWGVSDFLGGMATRHTSVIRVLAVSQPIGMVVCLVAMLASGQSLPTGWHLVQALAAGAAAVLALGLFYLALAKGTAVVVAPIVALGAAVPVAIGLAMGDPVTVITGIATLLALAGIVAASWESDDREAGDAGASAATIGLAVGAALATGLYLTLIDFASESGQHFGVIGALRLSASAVAIAAFCVWRVGTRTDSTPRSEPAANTSPRPEAAASPAVAPVAATLVTRRRGGLLLVMAGVGITDAAAEVCYAAASTRGALSTVAVLAGLYPVVVVALSVLVLRQRIRLIQGIGAVTALTGVLLFTASS